MIISARIKNENEYKILVREGVNVSRLIDKAIKQCFDRFVEDYYNNKKLDLFANDKSLYAYGINL